MFEELKTRMNKFWNNDRAPTTRIWTTPPARRRSSPP